MYVQGGPLAGERQSGGGPIGDRDPQTQQAQKNAPIDAQMQKHVWMPKAIKKPKKPSAASLEAALYSLKYQPTSASGTPVFFVFLCVGGVVV